MLILLLVLTACTADHEAMRSRLQYVSACNQADTVFSARWVPTVDSLAHYFSRHGTPNERLLACYLQGRVRHDMGEAPQALDCYQHAAEQADTTRTDCDLQQLLRVHSQIADIFLRQNMPDNAISHLHQVSRLALACEDTIAYINSIEHLAMAYYEQQLFPKAMSFSEKTFRNYLMAKDTAKAYGCLPLAIMSAIRCDSLTLAEQWLQLYECQSGYVSPQFLALPGHEVYYSLKGNYLLSVGKYLEAEPFFRRLQKGSKETGHLVRAYKGLYEVFSHSHQTDSMAKYAVLYSQLNDSTTMALRGKELQQQEALYNYSHSQEVAAQMVAKVARSRQTLSIIICSAMLFLMLALSICVFYWAKLKSKVRKANIEYFSLLMQYLRDQMLLQVVLDGDVKDEEKIGTLQDSITDLKMQMATFHGPQNAVWEVDDMLLTCPAILHFHELAAKGKSPTPDDWKTLRQTVNDRLPGFLMSIGKLADIGASETNVCVFVKLLFTPSEICSLLNISSQSLTNIRTRLLRKMFGKQGGARDFDREIRQLEPQM